jgi:hypothetical protein
MGEKLCLGETCISEPELQQSSTCDRNQQPPAPTYHRIAFSRLRHCVASRPAPAHARLRWNKVIDSAFPAHAACLQGPRTHPACCYRGSSDVLCRLRSVLTGEEYMRSALVALTCTLLAACSAVAQEAPRSPGPTNPNPPQQTPLDETKSGSRALTGNDDIPDPQHRTPLSESTSNPISSPCRQPRSNNQTLLRGNASLPQTHAGQSLPGIFFGPRASSKRNMAA